MRRYLAPAVAYAVLAGLAFLGNETAPIDGWIVAVAFAAGYLAVSLWWILVASRKARPIWPHLVAVWAPAILPVWGAAGTMIAMTRDDNAGLMAFVTFPVAAIALASCAVGALRLLLDRAAA